MKNRKPVLVSIIGPTAVGKTELAIKIATTFATEIVSADSRQFYHELTIGTAKPSNEELKAVAHHFIDSHSIKEDYSAGQYGRDAEVLLGELFEKYPMVVAVGGSSLYLKSLWEGFDEIPEVPATVREELNADFEDKGLAPLLEELKVADPDYYHTVDQNNWQRVIRALEVIRGTGQTFSGYRKSAVKELPYQNTKIGLTMDREVLFQRIDHRMDLMLEAGLFEEAEKMYPYRSHNALQTVGYSEIFGYMDGEYDKEEAIRLLKRNSRRYAKRQLTWFRRYDDIHWFEPGQDQEIIALIQSELEG